MSGEQARHTLTVDATGEGGPEFIFHCDGAPDSECHMYPDCGCESWVAGEHDHPFVSHEVCWMAAWFTNGAAVYGGPDAEELEEGHIPSTWPRRKGAILVTFEENYLGWEWDHSTLVCTEDKAALLVRYACSCGETMGLITDEGLVVMPEAERMGTIFRLRRAHLNHQAQQSV